MNKRTHFHFIGIGGIGMSAIAKVLIAQGFTVSGSDLNSNANTSLLESHGARVFKGHTKEQMSTDIDFVVTNSAIRESNPEFIFAKENDLKIIKRAEALSFILNEMDGVTVAGSHGKTTSSAYLSELLLNLNADPTFIIGGWLKKTKSNSELGKSRICIAEADESDASFLHLKSKVSVITNIDNDHLDFHGGFEQLKNSFRSFCLGAELLVVNGDDEHVREVAKDHGKVISYGQSSSVDYNFKIQKMKFGKSEFLIKHKENEYLFSTNITGDYNLSNLVGAMIVAHQLDFSFEQIKDAITSFQGIKRRYDILEQCEEYVVIDDYAHHPTEIEAFINSIKEEYPGYNIITFFEPHRYTRTQNFWSEFTECFIGSDKLYFLPIYAASENPIEGISSEKLFSEIKNKNKEYLASLEEIAEKFNSYKEGKNVVLSLGAGPISQKFRDILNAEPI